ncbi:hypothetical protein [Streptomyces luteogriseus]|uniref:hypothetical protein n=1 Tax=Streptomyces luteogriseus TaxID=68233 RepID=UPI002E3772FA|nr:hypothetical protein [Streptomyces luteogriseus]WTJ28214.1 hypothetical protein OID52_14615 [Streptomyces luteogriseus]
MSSTRSRALVLLAALALAGCSSSPGKAEHARVGHALAVDGAQSSGTVGNEHARVGEVWYFALPVPHNTSSRPIEITNVAIERIPAGLKVVSYGAYDLEDTEGLPLLAEEGGSFTPDFGSLKDYGKGPLKVPAEAESEIFYLAKVKIVAPPEGKMSECRFTYRQGGQVYAQTLDCELELKVDG